MSDPIDALRRAVDAAAAVVGRVGPDQRGLPTPCADWDLQALLDHLVAGNLMYAMAVEGLAPDVDALHACHVGDDPEAEYRAMAGRALAAWDARGFEGTVVLPYGEFPATFSVQTQLLDQIAHAWDVAVATGTDRALPADLCDRCLAFATTLPEGTARRASVFGPELEAADDAIAADRLAAYLGRSV